MSDGHIDSEGFNPTGYNGDEEPRRTPTPFELSHGDHETFLGAADSAAEFHPGDVVADQFEVVRVLGRGGMGMVYEVHDRITKQRLALKAILPSILSKPKAVDRFVQEVNTARRLRHPGIVAVYDVRQAGPLLLFTMEYLDGKTLRQVLNERGKLPLDEAVALLEKLCDALEYAHQYTVHRDISPENVMLLPGGRVKLLDFGIAKSMDPSTYTATHMSMGKAYYMAPEQRKDAAAVDHRADIFPLGVMFFEMLTGEMPMGYSRLTDMAPDVPADCDAVIAKSIVPVTQRYNTVSEFRRAIHACADTLREQRREEEAAAEAARRQQEEEERARLTAEAAAKRRREEAEKRRQQEQAEARRQTELAEERSRLEQEDQRRPPPRKSRAPLFIGAAALIAVVAAVFMLTQDEDGPGGSRRSPGTETAEQREGPGPPGPHEDAAAGEGLTPAERSGDGSLPTPDADKTQEPEPGESRTFAGIEMVWIPPGSFDMGSPSGEESRDSDEKQHRVTLTKGFWMGKYEVTQAQWQAVMRSNPSNFKGSNLPVENVSWNDCQDFIRKLNAKGQGTFRLPTEAEWEYACRAGTTTRFCYGDSDSGLGEYAWYSSNAGSKTHSVGQKRPNGWGLFDMHGNVWEWCEDWYGKDYYPSSPQTDPQGPKTGDRRVLRGGSWNYSPWYCRSANRSWLVPTSADSSFGFRVVCVGSPR